LTRPLFFLGKVYVSLDYESRFLGKEIIGVFVNRVGKSVVSIGISAVTAYFGPRFDLQYLSIALVAISAAWLGVTFQLTTYLVEEGESTTPKKDADKSKTE